MQSEWNGKPASGVGIKLAPGANALATVLAVKARALEIGKQFPSDVKVIFPYDTSPFVQLSIRQVIETLFVAIFLVFLVMFLFLQNFRATLIPTIAVPVVLLGTFAVLALAGFSINTLTLFGMVLAIGLLVDDAIVVVENVERLIQTEHLSPERPRTSRWMRSRARCSGSRSSSPRCSCPWRSWAARPASSTASSRSRSSRRWCCP